MEKIERKIGCGQIEELVDQVSARCVVCVILVARNLVLKRYIGDF